jgi:hypothetical protein
MVSFTPHCHTQRRGRWMTMRIFMTIYSSSRSISFRVGFHHDRYLSLNDDHLYAVNSGFWISAYLEKVIRFGGRIMQFTGRFQYSRMILLARAISNSCLYAFPPQFEFERCWKRWSSSIISAKCTCKRPKTREYARQHSLPSRIPIAMYKGLPTDMFTHLREVI